MNSELIIRALHEYGIKEQSGIEQNSPEIIEYFKEIGFSWVKTDETSWCSAFVNYIAKVMGYQYSGKLDARSWLNVGAGVKFPEPGDIAIFWRIAKNDWRGHVGFFIRETEHYVWVLGGNQSNMVCIKRYPKEWHNFGLLEYRRIFKT